MEYPYPGILLGSLNPPTRAERAEVVSDFMPVSYPTIGRMQAKKTRFLFYIAVTRLLLDILQFEGILWYTWGGTSLEIEERIAALRITL